MRRVIAFVFLLPLVVQPARADGPFEGRTIVTGMELPGRIEALRRILGIVASKRAGDPDLQADMRLITVDPRHLLQGFAYLDRMSDIPKHDEQGSRQRPFDLIAQFDPAQLDALLLAWGVKPWSTLRPPLAVRIDIRPRTGPSFPLRADTDSDERHRGALLAAADLFGMVALLPARDDPVPLPGGAAILRGVVRWDDAAGGWLTEVSLTYEGTERRWRGGPGSFDEAYRIAVGGAARALSGR